MTITRFYWKRKKVSKNYFEHRSKSLFNRRIHNNFWSVYNAENFKNSFIRGPIKSPQKVLKSILNNDTWFCHASGGSVTSNVLPRMFYNIRQLDKIRIWTFISFESSKLLFFFFFALIFARVKNSYLHLRVFKVKNIKLYTS